MKLKYLLTVICITFIYSYSNYAGVGEGISETDTLSSYHQNTIVITHGYTLNILEADWKHYKWLFCMADAVSKDRQILLFHAGQVYSTQFSYEQFNDIAGKTDIEVLINNGTFTTLTSIDKRKDVVIVFDWIGESSILGFGYAEAAADALTATLIQLANTYPWLLENLHFIGHSRGTVVNSEAIERLIYFASNNLMPPNILLDTQIQMTTLDAHPAGHWQDALEPMNDDRVNSANIVFADDGQRIGVVGWKSGNYQVKYIDNYYETEGFIGKPVLRFKGLYGYPGSDFNYMLDYLFLLTNPDSDWRSKWHSDVHAWYHGTVDTIRSDDEFGTGSGRTIDRVNWYPAEIGFYRSTNRGGDLTLIESNQNALIEVSSDANYGSGLLVFNGDFQKVNDSGWSHQGGEYIASDLVSKLTLSTSFVTTNSSATHNNLYIPMGTTNLSFKYKVYLASSSGTFNVYMDNSLIYSRSVSRTTNWGLILIPISAYAGTSKKIKFELSSSGSTTVWVDNITFTLPTDALTLEDNTLKKEDETYFNETEALPDKYSMDQNFPNPFNPITQIHYAIPEKGFVSLKVFDILGKEVATLVSEEKEPGFYTLDFNGNDLSSGLYVYRIQAGNFIQSKKMILMK